MEQCKKVILEAGHKLTSATDITETEKTDFRNLVTQYDRQTQEFLMENLAKIYPGATFLCEEEDVYDTTGEYVFIIDPIDGTANFTKNYNQSAISVALAKNGVLQWGIIYNPFTDELFEGSLRNGAKKNGKPIHTGTTSLQHSLVSFGTSPYYPDLRRRSFRLAEAVMEYSMDIRRSGSAALDLCYVAEGRTGVYFEELLSPWDFAAGMLIVSEAGGIVTDGNGHTPDFTKKSGIFAGNPAAQPEFLELRKKWAD